MSATGWSITCGAQPCLAELSAQTVPELRNKAREAGWLMLTNSQFCPEHRAELERDLKGESDDAK